MKFLGIFLLKLTTALNKENIEEYIFGNIELYINITISLCKIFGVKILTKSSIPSGKVKENSAKLLFDFFAFFRIFFRNFLVFFLEIF